eukprot:TRINITY_DN6750_c0_g1_i2.p1 TRINITY_DN6750_c0_g1~~TRINITY_DN6750_c0_g1_i2.p1  ORF type:complete len:160 (-),score=11.29 TRINITY_DN6750_c0_g1_i2:54-533(-)
MGWGNFLKAVLQNIDVFALPVVTLLYPLYASVRAIESPSRLDDQQWLTYWVLYSFITLFEMTFYKILAWLPLWPYLKLIATCWLVLPTFNGAAYVYENYVRQCLLKSSYSFGQSRRKFSGVSTPKMSTTVDRFVEKYGWDGLERALKQLKLKLKHSRSK